MAVSTTRARAVEGSRSGPAPRTLPAALLAALLTLTASCATPDPHGETFARNATATAREEFRVEQLEAVQDGLHGPVDPATWPGLWWTAGLLGDQAAPLRGTIRDSLHRALLEFPEHGPGLRRAALRGIHALTGSSLTAAVQQWLSTERDSQAFAIGTYHVFSRQPTAALDLLAMLEASFPDRDSDPRLVALHRHLSGPEAGPIPPLVDLLTIQPRPGHPVVFSLQRRQRRWPGLAVVRGADGRFVRESGTTIDRIQHLPHLTLSNADLPGTLTYGNTPQGVYTVCGTGLATNEWIGPTPYLHSKLPIEADPAEFLHQSPAAAPQAWTEALYAGLLPPSWRGHLPMREAWLAARVGRSEILMHGTTIDPAAFAEQAFHPLTPSAGCLTAMEIWDDSGNLEYSDQRLLLDAWQQAGGPNGFLVVVEIDGQKGAVTYAEIEPALREAERRLLTAAGSD